MKNLNKAEWMQFDYEGWLKHFQKNQENRLVIDKSALGNLTTEEKRRITPSITAFHQGEQSEGHHLKACALLFAKQAQEPLYLDVIPLFIQEENFHSSYLGVFMKGEGIAPRRKNKLDALFTKLRQKGGIEAEVTTLVTAEIIALTYYRLLARATNSIELKKICKQMLEDEQAHIVFQAHTISHFKQSHLRRFQRKLLMEATTFAVYVSFHKFFKETSCSFQAFRQENLGYLKQLEKIVRKKSCRKTTP